MLLLFFKYVVILIPKGVKVGTEEQKTGKCVKLKKKKNQKKVKPDYSVQKHQREFESFRVNIARELSPCQT